MGRLTHRLPDCPTWINESDIILSDEFGAKCYIGNAAEKLASYEDLEEQGLLLKLPCSIGTPVYYRGLVACEDCIHGKNQTYKLGFRDPDGFPYADDCEEVCIEAVRSVPFSLSMLEDDGTLDKYWKLNKEDVKI